MPNSDLPNPPGDFVGPWYTWWPGDPLPDLPHLRDLIAAPADDDRTLAALAGCAAAEIAARRGMGHRPYLARLAGTAVAQGWSAWSAAEIGELGLAFDLPPGNRYLWDFATAEPWRGRGIYPRLLQRIIHLEGAAHTRYWIGHAPDNAASARGILKAGFRLVGHAFRTPAGAFVLSPLGPLARAEAGAAILGATIWERGSAG